MLPCTMHKSFALSERLPRGLLGSSLEAWELQDHELKACDGEKAKWRERIRTSDCSRFLKEPSCVEVLLFGSVILS